MKINPFMSICPPLGFIFSPYILTLTHRVIDMCVLSKAPLIVVNMAIEQWQLMPQRNQSQTCSPPLPATRCGVHHIFCWFKKWVWSSLLFPSFTCNVCISPPPPHTVLIDFVWKAKRIASENPPPEWSRLYSKRGYFYFGHTPHFFLA